MEFKRFVILDREKKIIFIFTNSYKSGKQAKELLGVSLA